MGTSKLKPPSEVAARLIHLAGGKARLFEVVNKEIDEFNSLWGQDAERMGRVLRAHLVVEYFLAGYLRANNPNLGSLDGITFRQKVTLLGEPAGVRYLKSGLVRLNEVRNRLGHRLMVDVTDDDRAVFLSIGIFTAMRKALGLKGSAFYSGDDALSVLEDFARFAGAALQAGSSEHASLWAEAMREDT